jgi:hypothetical protein
MCHCLVCSAKVGAADFAANSVSDSLSNCGIPRDSIGVHGDYKMADTGAAKRDRLKRLTLLSSIKALTMADWI